MSSFQPVSHADDVNFRCFLPSPTRNILMAELLAYLVLRDTSDSILPASVFVQTTSTSGVFYPPPTRNVTRAVMYPGKDPDIGLAMVGSLPGYIEMSAYTTV